MQRRQFLQTTLAAGMASLLQPVWSSAADLSNLKIATFRFDVTPPMEHPLCGGWIKPVVAVDDALEGIGFVLTGLDKPVVVCAIDWTGLLNAAHLRFRESLASAAGTVPENVAIQCVHQHNAPFVCLDAERMTQEYTGIPHTVFVEFYEECLQRGSTAVAEAMTRLQPVTHVAHSQATVEKVASNRRFLNDAGQVQFWRGSSCKDPALIALPEGLIDPQLRTVAFYQGDRPLVSCHYYATHPMSYYGDGRVTSDFVGLARKRRQSETPGCTQIYFTGCSGNIAAGKYNDASPRARADLTDRIYTAIVASEQGLTPQPIEQLVWQHTPVQFSPSGTTTEEEMRGVIANQDQAQAIRVRGAMKLAWMKRCEQKIPVILSALHVNRATLLHLPGESFIEYQLWAQQASPSRFVATAAYGDGGMWYIPTEAAFPQGGYEVSVAFGAPASEQLLKEGLRQFQPQAASVGS